MNPRRRNPCRKSKPFIYFPPAAPPSPPRPPSSRPAALPLPLSSPASPRSSVRSPTAQARPCSRARLRCYAGPVPSTDRFLEKRLPDWKAGNHPLRHAIPIQSTITSCSDPHRPRLQLFDKFAYRVARSRSVCIGKMASS